jgi:hypothetical protein
MEISYLDFEIRSIKEKCLIQKGRTVFDPLEKSLIFYGAEDEKLFIKSLQEISVIPHFLREHKIAFKDEEAENLITIECNKNETLDIRSFRFLLNQIISLNNKMMKKPDKSETK